MLQKHKESSRTERIHKNNEILKKKSRHLRMHHTLATGLNEGLNKRGHVTPYGIAFKRRSQWSQYKQTQALNSGHHIKPEQSKEICNWRDRHMASDMASVMASIMASMHVFGFKRQHPYSRAVAKTPSRPTAPATCDGRREVSGGSLRWAVGS